MHATWIEWLVGAALLVLVLTLVAARIHIVKRQ